MMTKEDIRNYYNISDNKEEAFAKLLQTTQYTADALHEIIGTGPSKRIPVSSDNKAIQEFHRTLEEFESKEYKNADDNECVERLLVDLYNKGVMCKDIARELNLTTAEVYYKLKVVRQNAPEKLNPERAKVNLSKAVVYARLRVLNKTLDAYTRMVSETKKQIETLQKSLVTLCKLREDTLEQINLLQDPEKSSA